MENRYRLKKIVKSFVGQDCGIIIRTEAAGCSEEELQKDFNNSMILYTKEELLKNEFFGKNRTKYAEDCLGEYISLCKKGYAFYNIENEYNEKDRIFGNHTGLTKDEMEIPLIVITK